VLLFLAMLFTGQSIPFDNTSERYFVEGDPARQDFDRLIDLFGDYEYFLVGIEVTAEGADVLDAEIFSAIDLITGFFENHASITQVRSLSNYQITSAQGDELTTDYLASDIDILRADTSAVAALRDIVSAENLAIGTLVTEDLQHARIAALVEHRNDTAAHKVAVAQDLYQFIESENLGSDNYRLHYSGYPQLSERFETLAREDLTILLPLVVLVMSLTLYLSFRTIQAVVMPVIVIGMGVFTLNEIQSYLNYPHTTVDQALLPTMLIIGIGISIHVLLEYYHNLRFTADGRAAAFNTVQHLWLPCFFTAVTTSAGFLALSVIRILPIKEFAILGALGPLLLFLFAMTLLPALLSYTSSLSARTRLILSRGIVTEFTGRLSQLTLRYRNIILAGGALAMLLAFIALPQIQVDTNYITLFKRDSTTRLDIEYFDAEFKGVMTLDIVLDSGSPDGIKDPGFLRQVEEFQAWLEDRPGIGPINSLTDYLKEINQALHGDDPDYYRLPDSSDMTAQFILLFESSGADEDLYDIRDFEDRYVRIIAPIINMPASDTQQELEQISAHLEANFPDLDPLLTGSMVLKTDQDIYAAEGMSRSFLVALLVISLFFIILFKSFKYGLLSIIPSVLPILLAGSVAALAGLYLDLSTMLVGAMTMGIAVDDAIHVMNRYLKSKTAGYSTRLSLDKALHESGRAVVFSSLVLVLGFSLFSFASFTTIVHVGIFGSIIISLALLGDLLLLPAILYAIDGTDE